MIGSLVITLREGLEAALVISVVLAHLTRVGRQDRSASVWLGAGLAILVSTAVGSAIMPTIGSLEGTAEQVFEGTAMLLAVAALSYTILWMRRQAGAFQANLRHEVSRAVQDGSAWTLVGLAFLVVVREGIETVLFLFGAVQASSPVDTLIGGLLGLVLAVGLGLGLYRGGLHLDLRTFFNATALLLIMFAAGMLAHGAHELIEAGFLPGIIEPVWDLNPVLSEQSILGQFLKALFGYNGNPTLVEVAAYIAYLGAMTAIYLRPASPRRPLVVERGALTGD